MDIIVVYVGVQEMELAMSRADEAIKVGSAMKSQLSRLSQLESDNKKLIEDNSYLRQQQFLFCYHFSVHS